MKTWYIRVKTVSNGHFSACVLAKNESDARDNAMQQVREAYVPNLAWAETEILPPVPTND